MIENFDITEQTAEPGEELPEVPEESYAPDAVTLDPAPAAKSGRIKAANPPKPGEFVNHRVKATRPVAE